LGIFFLKGFTVKNKTGPVKDPPYCFFINKILGVNFDVNPDRPTKIPKTIFPKNKTYKKNIYLNAITAARLRNALS
jgi:hypothetical protein